MAIDENEGYWILLDDDEETPSAGSEGYWVLQEDEQPEDSTAKSVARTALQAPLGAASMVTYPADILAAAAQGATLGAFEESDAMEEARRLFPGEFHPQIPREEQALYAEEVGQYMPTQSNLERVLEETTGLPLQARDELQKMLRLGGEAVAFRTGGLKPKLFAGAVAPAVSQAAKAMDVDEGLADVAGLIASSAPMPRFGRGIKETEKYASGLMKPRAVESKLTKFAKVSPEVQERAIQGLNEEASKLTKKVLETEKPILKQMSEGVDFEKKFEEGFKEVRKQAAKYNPTLDVSPVADLMKKSRAELRGIPQLSSQSKKILSEAKAFSRNPPSSLYESLKTYRENNKKLKGIYEQALVKGSQKEYANFLQDYNSAIRESMKKTLPADSAWMKQFENLNKEFSEYLNAKKAETILKPVFGAKPTISQIEKLIDDPRVIKKLQMAVGEKGAQEISTIMKDLKDARNAIAKMPKSDYSFFEKTLPIGYDVASLIPFGKLLKVPYYAKVGTKAAQLGLGHYLVNPASRRNYIKLLESVKNKDPKVFGAAAKKLIESAAKLSSYEEIEE